MQRTLTIKDVAKKTGVSEFAVRNNVGELLVLLPVRQRVAVMEYMLYCKKHTRIKNEREVK